MKSKPRLESQDESSIIHATGRFLKDKARAICGWAATIGAALMAFWLSEGTVYHQLVVGLLLALVSLFAALALLESLWRTMDNQPPK